MAALNRYDLFERCINFVDDDFFLSSDDMRLLRPYDVTKADVTVFRKELRRLDREYHATLDPMWQWIEESNYWGDNTLKYIRDFAKRVDVVYPHS